MQIYFCVLFKIKFKEKMEIDSMKTKIRKMRNLTNLGALFGMPICSRRSVQLDRPLDFN